jgi:Flp pilus assembly protein TadD
VSSIQQALRKAQRARERNEGNVGFLMDALPPSLVRQKRRIGRGWLIGVGLLLLSMTVLFVYGRRLTGSEEPVAQRPVQKPIPALEVETAPRADAGTAKGGMEARTPIPPSENRLARGKRHIPVETSRRLREPLRGEPSLPAIGSAQQASRPTGSPAKAHQAATLEEARRLRKGGDSQGAERVLVDLLSREPNRIDAIVTLANLYLSDLGQPDKASSLYKQALALDPDRASTHVNLGVYYLRVGERVKAREHINRALALDPMLAEAHYNLACLCVAEGNASGAERALQRAIEIDSRCVQWAQEDPDLSPLRKTNPASKRESR